MGQKLMTGGTTSWSMDDWAYGTGENAVQLDEVIDEATQMPMKYFGGNAISQDTSMQQMQHDLLAFDQVVKKLFFWRRKKKKTNQSVEQEQVQQDEYDYAEDGQYYDGNPQSQAIIEETDGDINEFPPFYENQMSDWICDDCHTTNKSTNIECQKCKDTKVASF